MHKNTTFKWGIDWLGQGNLWASICLSIVLLGGCKSMTTMDYLVPASNPEVAKLKTVAVYPFEGRNGKIYSKEIEALLSSVNVNGKQYFTVVERSKLDGVIEEQKRSGKSIFDENTATKVGNLVGAQGVYMGTITTEAINDSRYKKPHKRCVTHDKDGKCTQWRSGSVPCIKRTAAIAFTIRLVPVETGTQVYHRDVSGEAHSTSCDDSSAPVEGKETLARKARQVAYAKIRKDIAPHSIEMKVALLSDSADIETQRAKMLLKNGNEYARANRMDRACELWQEGLTLAPQSYALTYNLGVCAESVGDFENAKAFYHKADRMLQKPDPVINKALVRIDKFIRNEPITTKPNWFKQLQQNSPYP